MAKPISQKTKQILLDLAEFDSKYTDCKCLDDVAKVSGLRKNTLRGRLYKNKMTLIRAVTLPFKRNKSPVVGDSVGIDSICEDYGISKSAFIYAKYNLGLSDHDSVDYAKMKKKREKAKPVNIDNNLKLALGIRA